MMFMKLTKLDETIKMRKMFGEIYLAKSTINLQGKFIDIPKFVENNEDLEFLYNKIENYFNVKNRVSI